MHKEVLFGSKSERLKKLILYLLVVDERANCLDGPKPIVHCLESLASILRNGCLKRVQSKMHF